MLTLSTYILKLKAFDRVDHGLLLNFRNRNQWQGRCVDVQVSVKLTQFVSVNGTTSREAHVRSGELKLSVSGPHLFLIHISDINKEITDSTVSCCAEDYQIIRELKDEE